ncbi:hypothetical protein [Mangrovicoccus sp. HB161399]|uniref:hypothetical protein n=1 Tax=Mangrovicoccus sp. HB161399 TaxID=2720392 RepID=UPI001553782E|nr:hypothetical protein [Mangrovicoccus sp. HB161399]
MSDAAAPFRQAAMPAVAAMQAGIILCLVAGAATGRAWLGDASAGLALIWIATQWTLLIPMARLFVALAAAGVAAAAVLLPDALPGLWRAVVQGTGFAALMMVLGFLRQPVKRAALTRDAAGYLLGLPPGRRYGAVLSGAQAMALMFNVGIIPMIGDLTEPADGRDARADPARRAMVAAAMRGAALVTIWSPLSLGFAIVTTGLPALEPLRLIAIAFGFTMAMLAATARWPLLPAEARPGRDAGPAGQGRAAALALVLAASAGLLAATILLHRATGLGFTLTAVTVLPVFTLGWLALEGPRGSFGRRLGEGLAALGDLRSESALFMAANVIGAALSAAIQASPLWPLLMSGGFASLPVLLAAFASIPLAASLYLPNSIFVVMAAQVLGPTALGEHHPTALGLALCIGWAVAICVNPISAMTLITGRLCGVSAARVAHRWNLRFALAVMACGALLIAAVYRAGG